MNAVNTDKMLQAGCAVADITPPLQVGLLMSSVEERWAPFESVRLPLMARVLVLGDRQERVALASYDLLGLSDPSMGGWEKFKADLATSEVSADRIVLACTHSHTAPESVGITDLHQTSEFRNWMEDVKRKTRDAIREASSSMHSCVVQAGSGELSGFSLRRRIHTPSGVVMSDSMQPIAPEYMELKPIDRRVRSLTLQRTDGRAVSTIVHAVCHPVHEMCMRHISPDYPGETCRALDVAGSVGMPMFLNGAAGNINPPTVSCGTEASRRHGKALADTVIGSRREAVHSTPFGFVRRDVQLPARDIPVMTKNCQSAAHLSGMRLGDLAIVFIPGEPFVETALEIERRSPFKQTIVVGCCESTVGYVPPARVFDEGGYEKGPGKWSFLQPEAEEMIRTIGGEILEELWRQSK